MDSNSNSSEIWPKLEIDSGGESPRRESKVYWSSENTMKLIELLEKECKELWDVKNPLIRDRHARHEKHEYLANIFGTTSEEISRKIHNLRTQLNNELRKIKRRQAMVVSGYEPAAGAGGSGWEYFDALSFLLRVPPGDPLEPIEGVNLAILFVFTMDKRRIPTRDEKLLKKRIAERQRYDRIKSDPQKYEVQRLKERQKYIRKLMRREGTSKEMSKMQSKKHRKCNRERRHRKRKDSSNIEDSSSQEESSMQGLAEPEVEVTNSKIAVKIESFEEMFSDSRLTSESSSYLLAEFQADEEEEFGLAARAQLAASANTPNPKKKQGIRVAASAPPPLPPMVWPEEPVPRLRPGFNADECQIFGDFVASELRTLRSDESRKKLKRMIQKAILKIGEEEDVNG